MLTLSNSDFQRLVRFVRHEYGINLENKQQLITSRLSNVISSRGYTSFTEYIDLLLSKRYPEELDMMLNKLTTNYTYFMRESTHFEYFQKHVLPSLEQKSRDHVLSIWSAGCSSGEEPYTLSILLKEYFGERAKEWDTRILATDISQNVLDKAMHAVYEEESLRSIPPHWKRNYFVKTEDSGLYRVSDEIQSNVIFRPFNLMDPIQFKRKFDVIFCRNVMIYFNQDTKYQLVSRFYDATVPGGYLFIGHSENLIKEYTTYENVGPAIYRKVDRIR
jgi:chemotaxis protein methyltransferase CheR